MASKEGTIAIDVVLDKQTNEYTAFRLPDTKVIGAQKMAGPAPSGLPAKGAAKPKSAPLSKMEALGQPYAFWGNDNRMPTHIRQKIEQVPMAGQAIYKLIAMMYGNGLAYYKREDLYRAQQATGEEFPKVKRHFNRNVDRWAQMNKLQTKFMIPQGGDYRYYMNAFSQSILSNDKKYITNIFHQPAEHTRLAKQNERTLEIEKLHISPDFAYGLNLNTNSDRMAEVPLMPWYDQDRFIRDLSGRVFGYHTKFETPGITYYARPFWLGLFKKNGWMDFSASVSSLVNAMMKNQVVLKYQILFPESYFEIRHPEWSAMDAVQREKIIGEQEDIINSALTGTDNAYKSILTVYKQHKVTGDERGKIEIKSIDDKLKKDSWIPSDDKANAQIVQSLGLHPSQIGLAGDKMLSTGGGSDQREGFNTAITLNTMDQEILLEPVQMATDYNARSLKDFDVVWFVDHTHHTTTNNQESGLQPSSTTLTPE